MANAITEQTVRVAPDTEYRSDIIDPLPEYPDHAGKLAASITSGGFSLKVSYGFSPAAEIHASIARLRHALDQLERDVDEAIANQAVAL